MANKKPQQFLVRQIVRIAKEVLVLALLILELIRRAAGKPLQCFISSVPKIGTVKRAATSCFVVVFQSNSKPL
jgi:hypothetical protein